MVDAGAQRRNLLRKCGAWWGLPKALRSCSLLLSIPFLPSSKILLKGQSSGKPSQSLGWNVPIAVFLPLSEDYTRVTVLCTPLAGRECGLGSDSPVWNLVRCLLSVTPYLTDVICVRIVKSQ